MEAFLGHYNYWIVVALMMAGLYTVATSGNLVKKVIGLNLFQTSVFLFFISVGKMAGGTAPDRRRRVDPVLEPPAARTS